MNRLCSYSVRFCVWLAIGVLLYMANVKLMGTHWSVWKQVLMLDGELEKPEVKWTGPINQWLDLHHTGRYMARTHNDGTVELWDLMTGEQMWRRGTAKVTDPASYALDGRTLRELKLKTGNKVQKAQGSSMLVADTRGENALVVDLKSYKMWLVPGELELANGLARADVSKDGRLVMLGNQGNVKVVSIPNGNTVYEWAGEPVHVSKNGTVSEVKQATNRMNEREIDLEREIAQNTQRRNSLPTDVRMSPDGSTLVLLFSNYLNEADPSKKKTRLQAVDIKSGEVVWETARDGKCESIHFEGIPGMFCVRQVLEAKQIVVWYETATGTVQNEIPFTFINDRPIRGAEEDDMAQEYFYLDPKGERVAFTGPEPWIAKVEEIPNLFPLYVSQADVPLVRFSETGNIVATYSASGVVRAFYMYGQEELGYLSHPLGWLMFFSWIIWFASGMIIVWKWGKDKPGMMMPSWLGVLFALICVYLGYVFTDIAAMHAESLVETPWKGGRVDLVLLLMAIVGITYYSAYWLVRGARWSRMLHLAIASIKCAMLLFSALMITGLFKDHWHPWGKKWWGTPLSENSSAYSSYIFITWAGILVCLVILLTKDCSQWCSRLSERRRQRTLKELGQTGPVHEKVSG